MNNMTSIADASDRDLGMHRRITRRDFINGVAIPVGGALVLPRWASPHTDAAILEAHRAVQEVLQRRAMPLLGG